MPQKKRDAHLYQLARHGAESRLRDLAHEARLLLDMFPDLGDSFDPDELPVTFLIARGAQKASGTPPKGRNWTPAQRKAAARRMKAFWAKRKASGKS
ncbi:MAG: hypothetical protein ACM3SQ_07605 [Betaproteobacteria bacterium]